MYIFIISVQFSHSVVSDSLRPRELQHTSGFPVHYQLPELAQTHFHRISDVIQPSHPLSSPSPPAFNLSQLQGLSWRMTQFFESGGQSIEVSASASVLPMNVLGLISFRTDWFDLLAVQGALKNFLQHHSSKASVLWRSASFMAQLSHPHMTTRKTIALTRQTFVGKVTYVYIGHTKWLVGS